jgi:hypothetical protein
MAHAQTADSRSSTSCRAYRIAGCGAGRRVPLRARLQRSLTSDIRCALSTSRGPCWSRSADCGMSDRWDAVRDEICGLGAGNGQKSPVLVSEDLIARQGHTWGHHRPKW